MLPPAHIWRVRQGGGVAGISHPDGFHMPPEQPLVPTLVPPSAGGTVVSTQDHTAARRCFRA
jgi:hypothetical protein